MKFQWYAHFNFTMLVNAALLIILVWDQKYFPSNNQLPRESGAAVLQRAFINSEGKIKKIRK